MTGRSFLLVEVLLAPMYGNDFPFGDGFSLSKYTSHTFRTLNV